jgi:hypothetical protein
VPPNRDLHLNKFRAWGKGWVIPEFPRISECWILKSYEAPRPSRLWRDRACGTRSGREGGALNRQAEDRKIFEELIRFLDKKKISAKLPGQLMLEIGKFFLGTPYVAGILETKRAEHLVVNLREHDCITFVENVLALVWLVEPHGQSPWHSTSRPSGATSRPNVRGSYAVRVKSREKSFEAFRRLLQKIRYRQGRLQGYSSRLHYFSDWIHDNQKKGIVRDITAEIGGRPLRKAMTFMTTHPDLYPPLKNAANLRRMKSVERTIGRRSLFFIPKKSLGRLEDRIQDGDLIAITTNTEGLDIQHVGLASKVKNRIHLLHASSIERKVVLSKKTLYRYLMQSRARSGIMVARAKSFRRGNS